MSDILTITLSPAVDIAADIGELEANRKLRCTNAYTDPGGGGVNVSRAIKTLDGDTVAFVAVGGPTGDLLLHLMRKEGIETAAFQIDGLTRQCFAVTESKTGDQYRFTLPAPEWGHSTWLGAIDLIKSLAEDKNYIVLSGSPPPGPPADDYERLTSCLSSFRGRVILDVSGAPLARALAQERTKLFCLRLNWHEAQAHAERVFESADDAIATASSLVARGAAENVIITQGSEGAIGVNATDSFCFKPPRVKPVSAVGAGDSFVGAMTLALEQGGEFKSAVRNGVAAAAATMMTPATELFRIDDVGELESAIVEVDCDM